MPMLVLACKGKNPWQHGSDGLASHGAALLTSATVDTYNTELRDGEGFVGDKAGHHWRHSRTCEPRSMRPIGRVTENATTPNSGGGRKRSRGAWTTGRADPRVAGELDRFRQRLGEEGMRDASRAAEKAGRMNVPGAWPEQQAGLEVMARSFKLGREGVEQSAAWGSRLGREGQAAERERDRQEERQRLGLPPEPPPEHQSIRASEHQRKGLGLSR
jgi:hypothetical protein